MRHLRVERLMARGTVGSVERILVDRIRSSSGCKPDGCRAWQLEC
jgi:hypothetical protein